MCCSFSDSGSVARLADEVVQTWVAGMGWGREKGGRGRTGGGGREGGGKLHDCYWRRVTGRGGDWFRTLLSGKFC